MSIGPLILLVVFALIISAIVMLVRKGNKAMAALMAKNEAYFTSMFPDLLPYYHPKNVLEFVRARLQQPPARSGMTVRNPPGLGVAAAAVSFRNDKGKEREVWTLLDEAGRELSQFFFEADAKDGMVRVGKGKFRVSKSATEQRVRYWHPDREFKWSPPGLWKFVTRVFEQPVEASDRSSLSFGDSSSSSSGARTAAAAAGIVAAGGTFDGGGASAAWDGKASGASGSSGSDSPTESAATSY